MLTRLRVVLAAVYLLVVLSVSVALKYADSNWAEGGIPLLVVGLPWSFPVLIVAAILMSFLPATGSILATDGGNFFLFVIVCGGLNAVLIAGPRKTIKLLRERPRARGIAVGSAILLVAIAQIMGPVLDRDAQDRRRPSNVPKDAVHVGAVFGWWQHCTYDLKSNINTCRIWDQRGLILKEGEFVAADGGGPVKSAELQIVDAGSDSGRVGLKNGRILIPKPRNPSVTPNSEGHP